MTDLEEQTSGLPTAAFEVTVKRPYLDTDIEVVTKHRPRDRTDVDKVNQLVRRVDVKGLIEEKIEEIRPCVDTHEYDKAGLLEDLLEEVKASE